MLQATLRGIHLRAICPPRTALLLRNPATQRHLSATAPTQQSDPLPDPSTPNTSGVAEAEASRTSPSTSSIQQSSISSSNTDGRISRTITLPTGSPPQPQRATNLQPQEPYSISRTPSNSLPVYQFHKGGGNLKMTRVRRVTGDSQALRAQLEVALAPLAPGPNSAAVSKGRKFVSVNGTTGHVVVRAWCKKEVEAFLEAKGF